MMMVGSAASAQPTIRCARLLAAAVRLIKSPEKTHKRVERLKSYAQKIIDLHERANEKYQLDRENTRIPDWGLALAENPLKHFVLENSYRTLDKKGIALFMVALSVCLRWELTDIFYADQRQEDVCIRDRFHPIHPTLEEVERSPLVTTNPTLAAAVKELRTKLENEANKSGYYGMLTEMQEEARERGSRLDEWDEKTINYDMQQILTAVEASGLQILSD